MGHRPRCPHPRRAGGHDRGRGALGGAGQGNAGRGPGRLRRALRALRAACLPLWLPDAGRPRRRGRAARGHLPQGLPGARQDRYGAQRQRLAPPHRRQRLHRPAAPPAGALAAVGGARPRRRRGAPGRRPGGGPARRGDAPAGAAHAAVPAVLPPGAAAARARGAVVRGDRRGDGVLGRGGEVAALPGTRGLPPPVRGAGVPVGQRVRGATDRVRYHRPSRRLALAAGGANSTRRRSEGAKGCDAGPGTPAVVDSSKAPPILGPYPLPGGYGYRDEGGRCGRPRKTRSSG
jgi:hypothetical protein